MLLVWQMKLNVPAAFLIRQSDASDTQVETAHHLCWEFHFSALMTWSCFELMQ